MQPGRYEKRSATAVAVMLTSPEPVSRTELTITENISSRGARVVTKAPWSANDSLVIKSLVQSEARVIYSQPVRENVYAIGLELIAPMGDWRIKP
jgi:predicted nucleic acid-binding protein